MIINDVKQLLRELCSVEEIKENDSLTADLGMDSLGLVTLLLALEERFQITFYESDMNPFELTTVQDVIELVKAYKGVNDD